MKELLKKQIEDIEFKIKQLNYLIRLEQRNQKEVCEHSGYKIGLSEATRRAKEARPDLYKEIEAGRDAIKRLNKVIKKFEGN